MTYYGNWINGRNELPSTTQDNLRDEWPHFPGGPNDREILSNQNPKKMKKISLEMLRLSSDEVLERSQMKKITGGIWGQLHRMLSL